MACEELAGLLAVDLVVLRKRVEAQEHRLEDVERVVGEIAQLLERTRPDFTLSPWWWPAMLCAEAKTAWETLTS